MTHPCARAAVEQALARVSDAKIMADAPRLIRIETRS
jgi:hypothetical protein